MKNSLSKICTTAARIALIPLEILFYVACLVGLGVAGVALGVMHLVIAVRGRSVRLPHVAAR